MSRYNLLPAWYWTLATNEQPLLRVLAANLWTWINSGSRTRRTVGWFLIVWQLAVLIQLLIAPGAIAAPSVSGVAWTGITDTDGVPLASYMFVTDHGSLLNPGNKPLQMILATEAGIFIVIVTLGLWAIGWALDFGWLRVIAPAFEKVSDALSFFQSKEVLIFTMTIGAGIVCWHWLVHQHSKAMGKLVLIVMVILGGTLALSHGVTYLASEDGPLAMGRDVGLEVAKAIDPNLAGTSSSGGTAQVQNLQAILADTIARAPLQMWNTGYNLDKEGGSCKSAWSQYTKAGDEDELKDAIKDCGGANSDAIAERLDNPTGGQVGTGLLCIILGGIVLWFLALAAFRVIVAGVQALFYCVIAPPAFALAFMLGGSVAFAARCAADAIVSALAMGGYVVFLAGSMVAVNAMLNNPGEWGGGFGALVILAIVMVAMIHLLKRLNAHLEMDSRKISRLFSTGPAFAGGQAQPGSNHNAPAVSQGITFSPVSPFLDLSHRLAGATGTGARRSVGMLRNWQTGGAAIGDGINPHTTTDDTTDNPREARHLDPDQVPTDTAATEAATAEAANAETAARQAGTTAAAAASTSATAERAQAAAAVVAPEADIADIALQTAATAIHHHQQAHPGTTAYPTEGQTQPVPTKLPNTQAAYTADDAAPPAPPAPAAPPASAASPWSAASPATVDRDSAPTDAAAAAAMQAAMRNPWARPVDPSIYGDDIEPDPAPAPPAPTAPRR